jgi:hypothetical protein
MNGVDLIEYLLDRGRTHDVCMDIHGKKDCVQAAFPHAGYIDMTVSAFRKVVRPRKKALESVGVRVEDDRSEAK